MNLVSNSELFNRGFREKLEDNNDYLIKLLDYTRKLDGMDERISDCESSFEQAIIDEVLFLESNDDNLCNYSLEDYRKNKVDDIIGCINDYYLSMSPYEAMEDFLNGDYKMLIVNSKRHSDLLKKTILSDLLLLSRTNDIEFNTYGIFKETINKIASFLENRNIVYLPYSPINKKFSSLDKGTPFYDVDKYVSSLLIESSIIDKFSDEARVYVCKKLEAINRHKDKNKSVNLNANVCYSLLNNYSLLSFFSNNPEKITMSDKMFETIAFDIANKNITRNEIEDVLINGNIKFNKDQKKYIKDVYLDHVYVYKETNILTQDSLVSLVR